MPANVQTIAYYGEVPCHGLGKQDLQLPGVRDTLWGAYNAITRFEDYKKPLAGRTARPAVGADMVWRSLRHG